MFLRSFTFLNEQDRDIFTKILDELKINWILNPNELKITADFVREEVYDHVREEFDRRVKRWY